jgi:CDP-diacylglycerol--glycerol-3-phosphate 3-phosphatidyltransferase/cardiolipin synthase
MTPDGSRTLRGNPDALMHYRLRDLWLPPGLLSLARVPLALAFPFVSGEPVLAVLVLFAAGASDVLDGWLARRYGWVTATGCALDPVTDKLFVLTVVITLVSNSLLSPWAVLLLSTRELGELPLVVWLLRSPDRRRRRSEQPKANAPGKIATVLQFATVTWALARWEGLGTWLIVTGVAGALAAGSYWRRELRCGDLG